MQLLKTQQPKESLYPSGQSERTLERLRLSMVILALIDVAAHVYESPGATPIISYWIDIETATYRRGFSVESQANVQDLIDRGDDRVTIRVAVVDDHPLSRRRVIEVLQATKDIEVVGEGLNSADAAKLVERLLPDVLIMELSAPMRTDLEAIQRLHALSPPLKILILSVNEEEKSFFDAMIQGAQGYIIKMVDPDELVHAVHRVHAGEAVVPGDLALRIFFSDRYHSRPPTTGMSRIEMLTGHEIESLTAREEEVLRELSTGAINKDIAKHLCISVNTVRFHVRHILDKLHLSNRAEAATYAKKEGL